MYLIRNIKLLKFLAKVLSKLHLVYRPASFIRVWFYFSFDLAACRRH